MPNNLKTDYRPDFKKGRGTARNSYTFELTNPDDPAFKLRRVIRSLEHHTIKGGLAAGGLSFPFPKTTDSLLCWPPKGGVRKFSLHRFAAVYYLSAIDQNSIDSYFLRSRHFPTISAALRSLTAEAVVISSPVILNLYNPLSAYAPFEIPLVNSDFESQNKKIIGLLEQEAESLLQNKSLGYLSGKIAMEYYNISAKLQQLQQLIPPSQSDFEFGISETD